MAEPRGELERRLIAAGDRRGWVEGQVRRLRLEVRQMGCPDCHSHKVTCFPGFWAESVSPRAGLAVAVPFECWQCGAGHALTSSSGDHGGQLELQLVEAWGDFRAREL